MTLDDVKNAFEDALDETRELERCIGNALKLLEDYIADPEDMRAELQERFKVMEGWR